VTKKQIAVLLPAASIMVYAAVGSAGQAQAQEQTVDVTLEQVADGLTAPLMMVQPQNDERRFIVEQGGTIRVLVDDGFLLDEPSCRT
jgi:serine protease inhibitor ecotin